MFVCVGLCSSVFVCERDRPQIKNAVDEIREFGQFVCRRNEERRVGYRSEYARQSKIKSEAKAAEAAQETSSTEAS